MGTYLLGQQRLYTTFVLVFSSGCHFSDASLAFRTSTGSLHEQPEKIRHGALAREPRLKLLPLVFKG